MVRGNKLTPLLSFSIILSMFIDDSCSSSAAVADSSSSLHDMDVLHYPSPLLAGCSSWAYSVQAVSSRQYTSFEEQRAESYWIATKICFDP
mmetsp:Transcript_13840/g.29848  ORF Transcript_13840/g.29848 Transcript_13840/m.29848 type:complete len:91 (-) Transcript_13840:3211-3483(-)